MPDPYGFEDQFLAPYYEQICRLCNAWADLETVVNRLFGQISQMPDNHESYAIINCIDFRDQIKGIKVGAVGRKLDSKLVDYLFDSLNYVDTKLRNRRNRFVHDLLSRSGDGATRTRSEPQYKRPQSRQPRILSGYETEAITPEDIAIVTTEIREEAGYLVAISFNIDHPDWASDPEFSLKPRTQRLLLRQQEKQNQTGHGN